MSLFSSFGNSRAIRWLSIARVLDRRGFLSPGTLSDLSMGCTVKPCPVRHRPGRIPCLPEPIMRERPMVLPVLWSRPIYMQYPSSHFPFTDTFLLGGSDSLYLPLDQKSPHEEGTRSTSLTFRCTSLSRLQLLLLLPFLTHEDRTWKLWLAAMPLSERDFNRKSPN